MCRDVKYMILLRNYHNTNADATHHSATTGNHWSPIKQQQSSVLIRCVCVGGGGGAGGATVSHQQ